jgi:hypothetical protein
MMTGLACKKIKSSNIHICNVPTVSGWIYILKLPGSYFYNQRILNFDGSIEIKEYH